MSLVIVGLKDIDGIHISFNESILETKTLEPDFIPSIMGSPKLSIKDGRITKCDFE